MSKPTRGTFLELLKGLSILGLLSGSYVATWHHRPMIALLAIGTALLAFNFWKIRS